jgi:hypothetical protein
MIRISFLGDSQTLLVPNVSTLVGMPPTSMNVRFMLITKVTEHNTLNVVERSEIERAELL